MVEERDREKERVRSEWERGRSEGRDGGTETRVFRKRLMGCTCINIFVCVGMSRKRGHREGRERGWGVLSC